MEREGLYLFPLNKGQQPVGLCKNSSASKEVNSDTQELMLEKGAIELRCAFPDAD